MRYEDRYQDRDERRDRSRYEDYGQADFSDNWRGSRGREEREFGRHDQDHDHIRDMERDEHRAWRPFGETGPTRYGGAGGLGYGAGYDRGQYDRSSRGYGDNDRDRYGRSFGPGSSYGDYRRDYGRGPDAGFGETGGRYSDSYSPEQYGRRDQWGSNPRGGSGNDARNWFDKAGDEVSSWFGDRDAKRRREWDEVRAGEHRGRGPKGYRRSDERIRDDVSDRLSDDSWLDASDVEVKVEGAEVTLTGFVASRDDKRRAEDLAERVSGVDNVQNQLRVRRDDQRYGDRTLAGDGSSTMANPAIESATGNRTGATGRA
jgi:osmotically-inducible protein OsmY